MKKLGKQFWTLGLALAGGLSYGLLETFLDEYILREHPTWTVLHDIIEWAVPVLIALTLASVISVSRQHKELNRKLSAEMTSLKSKILANTFASYILHEIRNPIHNLNAVLEKNLRHYSDPEKEVLERNMHKLAALTDQLKHMQVLSDQMDLRQSVDFSGWLRSFLEDSLENVFRKKKIRFERKTAPLRLAMHPLLLEQCFQLLFDNAIRSASESSERLITLSAAPDKEKKGLARITLRNSGALFSGDQLQKAGRTRVASREGSGLGLVLVRDTLKHTGGELAVANDGACAEVTLRIPLEGTET